MLEEPQRKEQKCVLFNGVFLFFVRMNDRRKRPEDRTVYLHYMQ